MKFLQNMHPTMKTAGIHIVVGLLIILLALFFFAEEWNLMASVIVGFGCADILYGFYKMGSLDRIIKMFRK